MAVTTVVAAEDGGAPGDPARAGVSFLDPLVARLSARYGVDPRALRARAEQVLASFAGARVQAFVPVLVEKRLHDVLRSEEALATREDPGARATTAAGGRRP